MDRIARINTGRAIGFLIKIFYYYDILGRIKFTSHLIDKKTDRQDIKYIDESNCLEQYVSRLCDYVKEKICKKYDSLKKIRFETSFFNSSNKFHNLFWEVQSIIEKTEKLPFIPRKENAIHMLIFDNKDNNLIFGITIVLPPIGKPTYIENNTDDIIEENELIKEKEPNKSKLEEKIN